MSSKAAVSRFTIDIDPSPEVAVVRCHGELAGGGSDVLYREVRQLIPHNKRIVLDLKDLTYIDSMGLGTIVRLYVSAKSAKCSLELVNIGGRVRQILGITNLLSVFTVIEDNNIPIH